MKIFSINKGMVGSVVLSVIFIGCGTSTSYDTQTNPTPTTVTVERGAVYDANVVDTAGKKAQRIKGSNKYKFADKPMYPIKVSGGWIDVNGDGNKTIGTDVILDIELRSYTNVITPVTTYIGDYQHDRTKLDKLIHDMNTSEAELLKEPSKAQYQAILLQNSVYKIMKENNTTYLDDTHFDDINSSFHILKTTYHQSYESQDKTSEELAEIFENNIMDDLDTNQHINRMDADEKLEFENIEKDDEKEDELDDERDDEKEDERDDEKEDERDDEHEDDDDKPNSSTATVPAAFINDVYPILRANCASCHSSNKGGFTANSSSTTTYNSMNSKGFYNVLQKGNGVGHGGGDQLNNSQYNTILTWINNK